MRQGFWKVAAAAPVLRVADCAGNAERIGEEMTRAFKAGVGLLVDDRRGSGWTLAMVGGLLAGSNAAREFKRGSRLFAASLAELARDRDALKPRD